MPTLFDPIKVGAFTLPNRIMMAPLTRTRAIEGSRVPAPLAIEYYAQRVSAGLIMTEATSVDPMGVGYPNTPGIWSDDQTEGWKPIVDAVHKKGGIILLQLWHVGRISDPFFLDGKAPVSASAIAPEGRVSLLRPPKDYGTPRALETDEIPGVIAAYKLGAENAKKAGFDGVEIHGANGYLIDQFLQDGSNKRSDKWGGSRENRARLMLEVTDACCEVWGADRVGMHLAPRGDSHTMGDSDLTGTFTYVANEMRKRKIAFICAREHQAADSIGPRLRDAFGGVYVANENFTKESGEAAVASGAADAVAYGKLYISNPDLVERFKANAPLNEWNLKTFYTPGPVGYTDYPALESVAAE
jgi:2,4-dienoyl-CoA reductase-like NADH-dependent reductase (Old Yellow Enzyme family)